MIRGLTQYDDIGRGGEEEDDDRRHHQEHTRRRGGGEEEGVGRRCKVSVDDKFRSAPDLTSARNHLFSLMREQAVRWTRHGCSRDSPATFSF